MARVLDNLRRTASPRRFVAVDFDARQLRVVHAERAGGGARVLKIAAVSPPGGVDVRDPRQVGSLLGATLKDMRLRNAGVLMTVTRGEAVLKPVTLPPGTAEADLAGMVQFQVEKELPFRIEEAVVDFTVETHYDVGAAQSSAAEDVPDRGVDVLVGAVRLGVVDHYRQIADAAGVKLLRLGLRPYANMRCVDACTRRTASESLLVVHFGAGETEIDVLVGNSLTFSRSVGVKVPPAGGDPHEKAQSVRSVVLEVVRSIQSYQAMERGFRIDNILVAGGTGVEEVAAEELSRRLDAPAGMFDPSKALGLGQVENPSALISALGLAISQAAPEQLPFDFLNPKRPPVRRNWGRIGGIAAAAVILLGLATAVTAGSIYIGEKEAALAEVRGKYNEARERQRTLEKLKKRVEAVREWQDERREWLAHWAYLSALFPSAKDAYVTGIKTGADGMISFTVHARDSQIITDLGRRLTEAGYQFQPGRLATVSDSHGYNYTADVRVFIVPEMEVDLHAVKPVPRPADDDSINRLLRKSRTSAAAPSASSGGSAGKTASSEPKKEPAASPTIDAATRAAIKQDLLRRYDRNRNGKLDSREFRYAYSYIRRKYEKLFDTDGDGRIGGKEYKGVSKFLRSLD